ncbi:hypothetical protein [Kitasatospora griseola]|uniref:hypothetical protein n=1 Tax=Kitasatospora griseola TaxID=2064 RepID=UPI001670564B|nr:hypothetical protein [Kitasatospora griseola]GGQ87398.1 hypothetical protein GCM10010195_48920 [Kitasatospora griseola]
MAAVLHVYTEPRNRQKAFLSIAALVPAIMLPCLRGGSVPTMMLVAADILLAFPLLFWLLREGIAQFERAGSPYVHRLDRSPEARRRGAWAALAVSGVVAVLLLLECLPIWPF